MFLIPLAQRVAILVGQSPMPMGVPAPTPEPPAFDPTLAAIPFDWRTAILPAIAALAALALLIWAARWLRRRFAKKTADAPVIPPALEATARLDALVAEGLHAKGDVRRHFYLVSEIVRNYVEGRYGLPAMERTTFEVERELKGGTTLAPLKERLLPLLKLCDRVKFSTDGDATLDEATKAVAMAREVIGVDPDKGMAP